MSETANRSQSKTIGAHYQRQFYQKHPERRLQYRISAAVNLLSRCGYVVTLQSSEPAQTEDTEPAQAAV